MKIAFITLGCKLNYAETSTYERGFVAAGLEVVPWREKADIYLINTCSVTETANSKSRNEIRKVHRINPDASIVVVGCYAALKPDEIAAIDGVVRVFGNNEKSLVVSETLNILGFKNLKLNENNIVFGAYSSGERTRSFLKVQDGCDNFCRYCTVPYARGRSRNIPVCECVKMAQEIAGQGVKEVVLTGVNTGDFGRTTGESFLDLLKALNEVQGIDRYRISSIEPNLLSEEIVDWIASGTKFQPHFHIPLQVGTNELLKAMGRRYTTEEFASKLDYIRKAMEAPGKPLVFFGIDVMVGLPGETDELFARSKAFLEQIHPAFIHVFPYSKRPGTPAATMPGQISPEVKKQRVAELEELCGRLHAEFVAANKGVSEKVLWESAEKNGLMSGYTGNYIRISRPYEAELAGQISEVTI